MKIRVGGIPEEAERWLPESEPDASGVGVNYADAVLKIFKQNLEEGAKMTCKRRGLKLTLKIGDRTGESLMRRLEHGPDVRQILHQALVEAAETAGATYSVEDGVAFLELDQVETPNGT